MRSNKSGFLSRFNPFTKYNELKKKVNDLQTRRPLPTIFPREPGIQIPEMPVTYNDLYFLAKHSVILRTIHVKLKQEIFRKGLRWARNFNFKCINCGTEYNETVEGCEVCGSNQLSKPDSLQLKKFEPFISNANKNKQRLLDVCRQAEEDLETSDEAYLILIKDYLVDQTSGDIYAEIREIIRGNPEIMRIVTDERGYPGNTLFTCILHRRVIIKHQDPTKEPHYTCPECKTPLHDVWYVATREGGDTIDFPYIEGEVVHCSKYSPSLTYGYPPILSIWKETSTLMNMMNYLNEYYKRMRHPKGVIMVHTSNPDSLYKTWDKFEEKLKEDPHFIPMIAVETAEGKAKGKMDFVSFTSNLMDMQFIQVKDDIRQRISALYGVSNILMSDTSGVGGLNNEGLQIKVTDRAVEEGQAVWEENIFPQLLEQFNITDFSLELLPSEEEDTLKDLQAQQMEVGIAQQMLQMGFNVEYKDEKFIYSGEAQSPQQMGGFGLPTPQQMGGENTEGGGPNSNSPPLSKDSSGVSVVSDTPGVHSPKYKHPKEDKDEKRR